MLDIYCKERRMGFRTDTGVHLTAARWNFAMAVNDRTGIVRDDRGYSILHIHPRRLLPLDCDDAVCYGQHLVRIRRNGKYGLVDCDARELISAEYDVLTRHLAPVNIIGRNGKFGLLNRLGEWVRPLCFDSILQVCQRGNNRLACIRNGKTIFL